MKTILYLICGAFMIACNTQPKPKAPFITPKKRDSVAQASVSNPLTPQSTVLEGYTFKYGFSSFDEDKISNPGYLRVYKNEQLLYNDTFNVQGEMYIHTLGRHKLSGDKFFFTLYHGKEACDYIQHTRYYFVSPAGKVNYLCDFEEFNSGEGYSSKTFAHQFPKDTSATLTVVESMVYHEHDQKDVFDTVNIVFNGDAFKINRSANNAERDL